MHGKAQLPSCLTSWCTPCCQDSVGHMPLIRTFFLVLQSLSYSRDQSVRVPVIGDQCTVCQPSEHSTHYTLSACALLIPLW